MDIEITKKELKEAIAELNFYEIQSDWEKLLDNSTYLRDLCIEIYGETEIEPFLIYSSWDEGHIINSESAKEARPSLYEICDFLKSKGFEFENGPC